MLVLGALLAVGACSKENTIQQTAGGAGVGAQCSGPGDKGCGVSAVCVLGFCRAGCTTDAECEKGALCVGNQVPYGCTLSSENSCTTSSDCVAGLQCGIDGRCRHGCTTENDCPRNEHSCIAGTCVSASEQGAQGTWFACEEGARSCGGTTSEGLEPGGGGGSVLWTCNTKGPGWQLATDCSNVQTLHPEGQAGGSCNPSPDSELDCVVCEPGSEHCVANAHVTCDNGKKGSETACVGETPHCVNSNFEPSSGCTQLAVDENEVTQAQYAAFLAATNNGTDLQPQLPALCAFNAADGFTPPSDFDPTGKGTHPVVMVDWCDAWAYCKWSGKRLCGEGTYQFVGGAAWPSASRTEWGAACASGTFTVYPYAPGNYGLTGADPTKCNVNSSGAEPVGSKTCNSPIPSYAAFHDLVGNVAEWTGVCVGAGGAGTPCGVMGGSFKTTINETHCEGGRDMEVDSKSDDVGFRCCGP